MRQPDQHNGSYLVQFIVRTFHKYVSSFILKMGSGINERKVNKQRVKKEHNHKSYL